MTTEILLVGVIIGLMMAMLGALWRIARVLERIERRLPPPPDDRS